MSSRLKIKSLGADLIIIVYHTMSWIKKLKGAIKIAKVEMPVVAANLPSRDYEVLETRAYAMDAMTGFTFFLVQRTIFLGFGLQHFSLSR